MTPESPPAVYRYGRLVLWLVLSLMLASMLYGVWHMIANWTYITV